MEVYERAMADYQAPTPVAIGRRVPWPAPLSAAVVAYYQSVQFNGEFGEGSQAGPALARSSGFAASTATSGCAS